MSHLDEQLHQVSEAPGRWTLGAPAEDEAEDTTDQSQVAAGAGVQLLRVPPGLTWRTGEGLVRQVSFITSLVLMLIYLPLKELSGHLREEMKSLSRTIRTELNSWSKRSPGCCSHLLR